MNDQVFITPENSLNTADKYKSFGMQILGSAQAIRRGIQRPHTNMRTHLDRLPRHIGLAHHTGGRSLHPFCSYQTAA